MIVCDIVQFYSPLSGGVKRYIHAKMRWIAREPGLRQVLIIPSNRNAVSTVHRTRIHEIRSLPVPGSVSYRMLLARSRIKAIVKTERPDLLEVGDPYRSAWIALECARKSGIPLLAFYHSDYPRALARASRKSCRPRDRSPLAGWIKRYLAGLYNRANATIAPSRHAARLLADLGVERVAHIPLGVDTEVFRPNGSREAVRSALGLPARSKLLLYVGRLAPEKNIDQILAMMDHLKDFDPPVHLLLVGDGEQGAAVRAIAARRAGISWRPYCNAPRTIAEYYAAADLFVHAGTAETFGLVSVEAQACGTRVVAVAGGGLEETLEGEQPPLLAQDARPASLADAVQRALALKESEAHREARRRRVVDAFSWDRTFHSLFGFYEQLCRGRPVTGSSGNHSQRYCNHNAISL